VAESHYLETWGDARCFRWLTVTVIQPLIAPLYHTRSAHEVLAAFSDKPGLGGYDAVRNRLKAANPSGDFEKFWRKTLNDGCRGQHRVFALERPRPNSAPPALPTIPPPNPGELEFLFRPDPTIYDGRFANNGWLQEFTQAKSPSWFGTMPHWCPKTFVILAWTTTVAARGGEHGQIVSTVVEHRAIQQQSNGRGRWIVPGQAKVSWSFRSATTQKRPANTARTKVSTRMRCERPMRSGEPQPAPSRSKKTGQEYPLVARNITSIWKGARFSAPARSRNTRRIPAFAHEHDETPPKNLSSIRSSSTRVCLGHGY